MKIGEWVKTLEVATAPREWWELSWRVDVEYTRPMPSDYTSPAEGGLEICSDPELIGATYFPMTPGMEPIEFRFDRDPLKSFQELREDLERDYPISHDTLWELVKLEVADFVER